ncbi:MAG: hypothetical protein EBU49_09070 [Proteobacteria bacterium]|nr:hypothetical protein [Pseudomonadota bacterium]
MNPGRNFRATIPSPNRPGFHFKPDFTRPNSVAFIVTRRPQAKGLVRQECKALLCKFRIGLI